MISPASAPSPSLASQVTLGVSSRNSFKLVPSKTALLVIDVQDYLSTPISANNTHEYLYETSLARALPNMVQLVSTVRAIRDASSHPPEVLFTFVQSQTNDSRDISLDYKLSGPNLSSHLPNPSRPATFSSLPTELQPSTSHGRGDILIPKTSCSVFQSTPISYMLRNLGIEQLILCGQLTHQCVESAARDAADLGFLVTVAEDACAANSGTEHEQGLQGMKGFARILSTETILQELLSTHDVETNEVPITMVPVVQDVKVAHRRGSRLSASVPGQSTSDAISALLYSLDYAGIEFLRFTVVDISNTLRTKAVPLSRFLKSSSNRENPSVHFSLNNKVAIAKVSVAGFGQYADAIIPDTQLGSKKVLALHPDVSTLRILPYASKSAMVMCTLWDCESISPFCTRSVLSQVIQQASTEFHIGFSVGVELEFCLFHRPEVAPFSSSPLPVDYSLFCQPTILNQEEEYISEVCHALAKQRISVDLVHAESAYGQLELVLPYEKDPLLLADHIVYARETIVEVAKKKNMSVLFLPKIYPDQAGNGMHLHLSLWDTRTGENIFPSACPGEISSIGQSFMEGILVHMPSLVALTNPTRNSFRRIGRGCWTGSTCSWDVEDKEVPMRICIDVDSDLATNVEYKLSDSTANVYLQIAGLLSSGLDGIRRNLQLRPAHSTELSSQSSVDLPSTLEESLDMLMNDKYLSQLLGPELLTSYVAVKRADWSRAGDLTQEISDALKRIS